MSAIKQADYTKASLCLQDSQLNCSRYIRSTVRKFNRNWGQRQWKCG